MIKSYRHFRLIHSSTSITAQIDLIRVVPVHSIRLMSTLHCDHGQSLIQHLQSNQSDYAQQSNTIDLPVLLHQCIELVNTAGSIIRGVMQSGELNVIDKSTGKNTNDNTVTDPQTIADIRAQHYIIGNLNALYNNQLCIVGEEGDTSIEGQLTYTYNQSLNIFNNNSIPSYYNYIPINTVTIWLDPLDGTREFTQGHIEYVTTLLGIAINGIPVAGIIGQPFHKQQRIVYGLLQCGIYQLTSNSSIQSFQLPSVSSDRRIVTTSRSHMSPGIQQILDEMSISDIVKAGGSGSKYLLLL